MHLYSKNSDSPIEKVKHLIVTKPYVILAALVGIFFLLIIFPSSSASSRHPVWNGARVVVKPREESRYYDYLRPNSLKGKYGGVEPNLKCRKDQNGEKLPIWTDKVHQDLVYKYLRPNGVMLEWGSGGSTTVFPDYVAEYYSIEHVDDWVSNVANSICGLNLQKKVRYFYVPSVLPDALEKIRPSNGRYYHHYVDSIAHLNSSFDFIFIDGRVRPQCALRALAYLRDANSLVFIHDFERKRYRSVVLDFYDTVEEAIASDGVIMTVLKPKSNWAQIVKSYSYPKWFGFESGSKYRLEEFTEQVRYE